MNPAPSAELIALTSHRGELFSARPSAEMPVFARPRSKVSLGALPARPGRREQSLAGVWLPKHRPDHRDQGLRIESGETTEITAPVLADTMPAFDPDGKYIYFIGQRDFDPVYDAIHFDLGFPKALAVCDHPAPRMCCRRLCRHPSRPTTRTLSKRPKIRNRTTKPETEVPTPVEIDFDGITSRVQGFRFKRANTDASSESPGRPSFRPFRSTEPAADPPGTSWPGPRGTIESFAFETQRQERLVDGISDFSIGRDERR